ncbi:hypothetical protein JKP88DRAFT_196325 [Tribonema minus]|uniref:Uncharacterized protein n=1 Tax=Tribonema minus TaxID=303371 RepID=A0A835YWY1_9STRA|nr:hypothetical protein JKP88DRAFT_196325 [Tribonema minus]
MSRKAVLHQAAAVVTTSLIWQGSDSANAATAPPQAGNCVECVGVVNDLLAPCPDAPTCVSTQDDKPYCFMEPWAYEVTTSQAKTLIANYLYTLPGAKIVAESERYLRAEVASLGGIAVDDVELYLTPNDYTVQFRANRRDGVTDLGQNRKRMERMRIALGFEKIPVLRNRTRAFIFGESFLDSFGPSGFNNEVPEEMAPGAMWDRDPKAPVFETPSPSLKKALGGWWAEQGDDRVRSR